MFRPNPETRLLVVGDVFVDYPLDLRIVRLGGIFHAARACHALGATYALGWIAPAYLESSIDRYANKLDATLSRSVGIVSGSPNVILADDAKESGDQRYDEILRDQKSCKWDTEGFTNLLREFKPTDVLMVPGRFPYLKGLEASIAAGARVHIDIQYDADPETLGSAGTIETVFVSTSAPVFRTGVSGDGQKLRECFPSTRVRTLILKENRGGSRVFLEDGRTAEAPTFKVATQHSIGVGDCFNCTWLTASDDANTPGRLARASYFAAQYASTLDHDEFSALAQSAIRSDESVGALWGNRLPWEDRSSIKVYFAAPDFPSVDTHHLDALEKALQYHNFTPVRPVQINGLHRAAHTAKDSRAMYRADMELLDNSNILVAIPLTNDPGTFTELGMASARGMTTILWDPHGMASNMFARHSADRVTTFLSEVIEAVFDFSAREQAAEWTVAG